MLNAPLTFDRSAGVRRRHAEQHRTAETDRRAGQNRVKETACTGKKIHGAIRPDFHSEEKINLVNLFVKVSPISSLRVILNL